ncbi:carbohydrate ABC transporter permease [Arthrobacter bambusae]|uniref:carbohydrate ABC transporter permease n=1 Tax=Arthrobacter bambusae TaxID=1338426 RepID=UPI0027863012|nr:multiple sugar transport system permease protein [Arthrobacter bambusae]MDQ0234060.1 multiple sugar transport system permease protein [Arthrobacter bambusae]
MSTTVKKAAALRRAPELGGQPPAKRRRTVSERNRPLWMLTPGALLIGLIIVVPLILGIYIAMLQLDQYTIRKWISAPFVGLKNFVEAFTSTDLVHAFGNSIGFSLIATVITVPIGIYAALATQNAYRGRSLVRSMFLIPYVLPSFVVGSFWRTMLQHDGIVNKVLTAFGLPAGQWLTGPASFWVLILVEVWAAWPFIYLMALSGLQSVDQEVHEAAAIDGALWWTKLRYVIFPYLRGPVALACLIATLHHMNNFSLAFLLFGVPAPFDVQILPTLVYSMSFTSLRFGMGAAMALISLLLIAIPLYFYLKAVRLDTGADAGGKK